MKTSEKIIRYIKKHQQVTGVELADYLDIGDRAVRKQLKTLLDGGKIHKIGKPPRVYYYFNTQEVSEEPVAIQLDPDTRDLIEENFYHVTPVGNILEGVAGFVAWCTARNTDPAHMAAQYWQVYEKYDKYRIDGLVDGTKKLQTTFDKTMLDELFYIDFYSVEIFGKTKLGQMLLFAKQSQDRSLINQVADIVAPRVRKVIKDYKIEAVGFIPPTVKRELQFMKQIEKRLQLELPVIPILKIKTPVVVPQKTLSKLQDRVMNAQNTIKVGGHTPYKNILLIDDAVGSGATLQETARKLRQKGLAEGSIIGLAITGSIKGFDVISEV